MAQPPQTRQEVGLIRKVTTPQGMSPAEFFMWGDEIAVNRETHHLKVAAANLTTTSGP